MKCYVPDSISSHPIIIYDRPNTYIKGYHRLYIKHTITYPLSEQLDKSGMKIWAYENARSGGIFIFRIWMIIKGITSNVGLE
jgi:hypothetical protein